MARARRRPALAWSCLALVALSPLSLAEQNAAAGPPERIARLEALLDAQQRRLAQLQAQLAAETATDAEAQRTAAMRRQIREILSEQEFRESLMPAVLAAGYDRGFYIATTDERFRLRVSGGVQFRWTHADIGRRNRYRRPRLERDDRTGFDLRRVRLTFSGHVYSKDLTYYIQLRADSPDGYDVSIRDAYFNYRFADEFQLRAGVFKVAATLSRTTSSMAMQFPERPLINEIFEFSRGLGVRLWGRLLNKRLDYFVDVVNQFNSYSGRTITNDPAELDNNPGLAARLVWHALGDDPGRDLAGEPDIEFHESPALDFAFHYAFNNDEGDRRTTRVPFPRTRRPGGAVGGFGATTTNGMQLHQFGLAYAFKWQGFSTRGEYFLRLLDPRRTSEAPLTPWYRLTGQDDMTDQHGAYVQAGYFLPIPGFERKIEAVGRVGAVSTRASRREAAWEYTGGLNYYIQGDRVKLQTDVTKITEAPISSPSVGVPNINDSPLIVRVQLQVVF